MNRTKGQPEPQDAVAKGYDEMTPLEQAQAALDHVNNAPVSPDGMRSPEEDPPEVKPGRPQRRAYLDAKTATPEDIEAFVRYLRGDDDDD